MNKYINNNEWIQLLKRELNLNIEKLIKQQFSIFIWHFDFYWKLFAFHYVVFFIDFVFFIQTFSFFIRVDRSENSTVVLWNEKKKCKILTKNWNVFDSVTNLDDSTFEFEFEFDHSVFCDVVNSCCIWKIHENFNERAFFLCFFYVNTQHDSHFVDIISDLIFTNFLM